MSIQLTEWRTSGPMALTVEERKQLESVFEAKITTAGIKR